MKRVYYLIAIVGFFSLAFFIFAQEQDPFSDIIYPVPELGNCQSREVCETFCDQPENMPACLDFAEDNNLMPEKDIDLARKMLELGETEGPGGCQGQAECDAYCDDISNIRECVDFAEKNGLIPPDELEEARKVISAIERGVQPPPCNSKSECDQICRKPENMKTCIAFAKEAGLMPPEELEEAEKVLAAIEKGATPPPCGGKEECDEYCSAPENLEQCLAFAEAAGFISPEEATMARKTGGRGPGGCRGKEVCEAYCEDPANGEECINFAVENGFMPAEEAENALKMFKAGFTSGPGGCKGKEECEGYCDDVSHMGECVDFAEKAGMMSAEDAARARKMAEMGMNGGPGGCKGENECRAFCEDPTNGEECLNFAVQIGEISPEEAEQARQGMEAMMRGGPGGCKSEDECKSYCDDPSHGEECLNFAIESGMMPPEEAERMREMMEGGFQEGMPSEGMPEGQMPPEGISPEEFQREEIERQIMEETQERMEGGIMPQEGMIPEGMPEGMAPEEFQQQIQGQIQEEIQRQIEQQTQQQMQEMMPQGEMTPTPLEMMAPPPESFIAPIESAPAPAPAPETQPTSHRPSLLGTVLAPFIQLFLR
ncbi:MAG: hypothetical protein AAB926_01935 [Patescibacteria group bacterium]